jgi:hypothetical protein
MLVAGHETTGSALTWTLYLLATNPSTMAAAQVGPQGGKGGRVRGERRATGHDPARTLRPASLTWTAAPSPLPVTCRPSTAGTRRRRSTACSAPTRCPASRSMGSSRTSPARCARACGCTPTRRCCCGARACPTCCRAATRWGLRAGAGTGAWLPEACHQATDAPPCCASPQPQPPDRTQPISGQTPVKPRSNTPQPRRSSRARTS